jgi:hypothetical protein
MTVPVFASAPLVARIITVAFDACAMRMAPLPKLSAVTIEVSVDSTVEPPGTVFPNLSAGRAVNRNTSPIPRSRTVSRVRTISASGPAMARCVNVIGAIPVTVAVAVCVPASCPSVHSAEATPSRLVTVVAALIDPEVVLQATAAPATFWPCASVTFMDSGNRNLVPTSADG